MNPSATHPATLTVPPTPHVQNQTPVRRHTFHGAAAALAVAAGLIAAPTETAAQSSESVAEAQPITLTGTLRDFRQDHPDMQNPQKSFGVKTGLVKNYLDADGKPVLDTSNDPARGMITGPESFGTWFRDVPGVNVTEPHAIALEEHPQKPGVFYFAREKQMSGDEQYFFPMDGRGFNDLQSTSVGQHNYYFTYELRTEFSYDHPDSRDHDLTFRFVGDDDVWVYINGKLAVDLGGVHGQAAGSVNLDDMAADLGLEPGGKYELVLFFAERHTTQSNFRIETTLTLKEVPPTTVSPLYD
ncbi:MAG: fibro-slime domain-containing protein [Planctomycetota bacterium]